MCGSPLRRHVSALHCRTGYDAVHDGRFMSLLSTRMLTELQLQLQYFTGRLPLSKLQHVLALRELRSLRLVDAFDAPLEEDDIVSLTPPSTRLPLLAEFDNDWMEPE